MRNKSSFITFVTAAGLLLGGCANLNIPFLSKDKDKNNSEIPAELPTDREHIRHAGHKDLSFSIKDLEEGVVTGDWTIEEVNGEKVVAETPAFIKFVPSEKRIYGNNGCNTINARYEYNKELRTISFSEMASTMRLCGTKGITDLDINAAIENTSHYSWDHNGDEYFIYLKDANDVVLLKLMHQNFDFLNGTWQVTEIENEPIDNPEMRLVIDVDEGKIHGNTGCNILNGALDIDMETANTLSFHDIIVTQMDCPNPTQQTRMIVALEDAAHARPVDADHVVLLNLLRRPVLTLKRI